MITVRDATREDCKLIYPMIKEFIKEWVNMTEFNMPGSAEGYERLLFDEEGARGAVAFYGDEMVGYVFYTVSASSLNCMTSLTMENFWVKPEYRRKGVGTAMYKFMQQKTLDEGRLGLEWFADPLRPGDLAFFAKMGKQPEMARLSYHWNNGNVPPEAK